MSLALRAARQQMLERREEAEEKDQQQAKAAAAAAAGGGGSDGGPGGGRGESSSVGEAYLAFFSAGEGADPRNERHLPKVECKIKINKLAALDQVDQTFHIDFTLMLDWVDPSLDREHAADPSVEPDWDKHFCPSVVLMNTDDGGGDVVDGTPRLRGRELLANGGVEWNHVTMTSKIVADVHSRMDLRKYPFDVQYLQLVLKLRSISDGHTWTSAAGVDLGKHVYPQFDDPVSWRYDKGHEIAKNADWLGEWDFGEPISKCIYGQPTSEHSVKAPKESGKKKEPRYDSYTFQIAVQRDATSITWNLVFPMVLICVLAFPAFAEGVGSLGDRLAINLTMLLTAMAFKSYLADMLPRVPYLTTLEQYVVGAFIILSVQGLWFWGAAMMHASWCQGHSMTWGETVAAGAPVSRFRGLFALAGLFDTTTAAATEGAGKGDGEDALYASAECLDLLAADKVVFALTAAAAIGIHVWLYLVRAGTRLHNFDRDGLFDLSKSAEFQSEAVSRPYKRNPTRALMNAKEKEAVKAAKAAKAKAAKEKEATGKSD